MSFTLVVIGTSCISSFNTDHKLSIRFMSGEFPGHGSTSTPFCANHLLLTSQNDTGRSPVEKSKVYCQTNPLFEVVNEFVVHLYTYAGLWCLQQSSIDLGYEQKWHPTP